MFSWGSSSSSSKVGAEEDPQGVSPGLEKFFPELTDKQVDLCKCLCNDELRQSHLFKHFETTASPSKKRLFIEKLEALDNAYPDGLAGYIENARTLLAKSKAGVNPLKGWKPSVPVGKTFTLGTKSYAKMEKLGRPELGRVGFVLVAGGLGERLGYGGIKVSIIRNQEVDII